MTKREAAIVSAYTGFLLGSFEDMHKYIEEVLGRGVFTHEMGNKDFMTQLRDKSKQDFINVEVGS